MKVLNQLILHFWDRGALTVDQAHYLVEHGFVRAEELENYVPRPAEPEDDDFAAAEPVEILLPDEWDRQADGLVAVRPAARKGRGKAAKPPGFDLDDLRAAVARVLAERTPFLPALVELARQVRPCAAWPEAAVALRRESLVAFREALVRAAQARPAVLGEVWAGVQAEPFHELLGAPEARGPVARAFGRLLRAASAEEFGRVGWVLKAVEVRAVANLLGVRRRLLAAAAWMYDHRRARLGRCLQRPPRRPPGWAALGFGLVLLHNARARRAGRTPTGFALARPADDPALRDAWATALALDPAAVTPLFARAFADRPAPAGDDPPALALYCPNGWKV